MAFCAMCLSATAQKVDLDRFVFQANFRGLPNKPLDAEYRTYSFNITSTSSVRNTVTDDQVKSMMAIDGWKAVDAGHIIISINMEDVSIENAGIKTREQEIKDKDGKVTGKKTYYFVQAIYSWAGSASVSDYKGASLVRQGLADRGNKMTWNSNEYETSSAATDYYNNNKYEIRNTLTRTLVNNAISSFRNSLNYNYGFRTISDQDFLWILDHKKHPEYEAQKAAWANFKEAVKMMNANDDLTTVREKLKPTIAYFDSLKVRVTGTEKTDKKLRYGAYYCLAKIYLLLDEPDAAIAEADLLIANDYDENDGKRIKMEANELKKLFAANKTTTRHFPIDVSVFQGPSK